MPVDKFSVSLPQDLADSLEEIAREEGVSRSAVVREAASTYVAARAAAAQAAERERRVASAFDAFERIARTWGDDARSGLDYLAEMRGEPIAEPVGEPRSEPIAEPVGEPRNETRAEVTDGE